MSVILTRICSTEEFWGKMCDSGFVRLSDKSGRIGNEVFWTAVPPEECEGFIPIQLYDMFSCLFEDPRDIL